MFFSILLEVVTIISSFLIPRFFIGEFGSNVNGLVTSISQFLGYLVLLQSGIGGVVKSSLYKPLSEKNYKKIGEIVKTTESFFKKLAFVTIIYIVILSIFFPFLDNNFSYIYTFSLVVIIGLQSFGEYYYGITYQMILEADQKQYIYSITQIICVIACTIITILFIKIYPNIHLIKLFSSLIFIFRPIVLKKYVYKNYKINGEQLLNNDTLKNRWDGVGHTIAYFIHNKTDIIVLSLFSSLTNVSIYSIYSLVSNGLRTIVSTVCTPLQATFGHIIAKESNIVLNKRFDLFELLTNIISVCLFATGIKLIIPFVSLYTIDFDTNYIFPLFSIIILLAEFVYCIRIPYHTIITAAGHYKQTKFGAFIEAGINITISIIMVSKYGLLGVAIGTLIAMIYRTVDYAVYLHKKILVRSYCLFFKRFLITILNFVMIIFIFNIINMNIYNYFDFICWGGLLTLISLIVSLIINCLFYKDTIFKLFDTFFNIIKRK